MKTQGDRMEKIFDDTAVVGCKGWVYTVAVVQLTEQTRCVSRMREIDVS